ncbi:MAG TPA: tellurite resistance/C4-dicarboxylate transporter family protein [Streptosporangiaceae bacterium]|nr:tellurite resistance/C4-dicarboxylate transporter family protein [Streptosporangiaceae bacterium]
MSTVTSGRGTPSSRLAADAVKGLHPAAFAFVMATGIVSAAAFLLGPSWLSGLLLALACAGLILLAAMLVARLIAYRRSLAADLQAPDRVFGFFTIVAGLDVLAARLDMAGHPLLTVVLGGLAGAVWLVLTYGVPATLMLARKDASVLAGVNGGWLLWVVGTQSLAITASMMIAAYPAAAATLATLAIALWSIGLILYLILVALIMLRWLTVPMTPEVLGPPYWILMGATAITVLAGAKILGLPPVVPIIRDTAHFVEGFSFALWAFGTWWIPLLILLGLWRHVRQRWPLSYEPTLWSVVFPLGMYSAATFSFGKVAGLGFMEPLSRFMFWVAVAAWTAVAAAFVAQLARRPAKPTPS